MAHRPAQGRLILALRGVGGAGPQGEARAEALPAGRAVPSRLVFSDLTREEDLWLWACLP